jgi:LysM repeat protein
MSKDVVIAAMIVVACLGVITLAFFVPRHKAPDKELASTSESTTESEATPTAPTMPDTFAPPSDPTSPLLANNNTAGTQPFAPMNPGTGGTTSFTPINDFPPINSGSSTGSNSLGSNSFPGSNSSSAFNNFPTNTPPPISAPITPVTTDPLASSERSHTVASGETLGEISHKYYQTAKHWKKIAEANKVDPSDLKVGQKLVIPVIEGASTTSTAPVTLADGERSYTIQKGDSYYRIAEKELGSAARWKEIEKLNNIPASDLVVGKTIKLPAKDSGASSTTNAGSVSGTSVDGNVHVVAAGETLSDISKKYFGTTKKWKDIVNANPGVDPEGLRVGQKLKLPEGASANSSSNTSSAPVVTPAASGATYTVKAGDTPASIAASELGSSKEWAKIIEANPGLDPRKLRIGQQLVIPGKSAPAAPANDNAGNNGFGFGAPTNAGGSGNSGFGTPNNNSGFGSGFPNSPANPAPANNFAPSGLPPAPAPNTSFTPGNTYPTPSASTPPSSAVSPAGTLPDSFGGASGFGNQP